MTIRSILIKTIAVATLSLGFSGIAQAEDVRVAYRPSELTTPAGQAAVLARVNRAVKSVCRGNSTLEDYMGYAACAKQLGGQIVDKINSPAITVRWENRSTQVAAR